MRGRVLSDPAVVGALQPFIVTYWEGRDHGEPADVQALKARAHLPPASNVTFYALSPTGQLVDAFSGPPLMMPGVDTEGTVRQLAERISRVATQLGAAPATALRDVALPSVPRGANVAGLSGIRMLATFPGEFNAEVPVVEAAALDDADRAVLRYPGDAPVSVDAARCQRWIGLAYPPAMMDQSNHVDVVSGNLEMKAIPASGGERRALLTGKVHLVMRATTVFASGRFADPRRNPQDFAFDLELSAVLGYPASDPRPRWIRGTLEGTYLRLDRKHGATDPLGIRAALESIP